MTYWGWWWCFLPRQDFLVCLHLKSSRCGTSLGWGESAEDLFEQCRQSWEGQGVWEKLAAHKGMMLVPPSAQGTGSSWLRPVLCYRKGWKNAHISLSDTYAMQAWDTVCETVVVETRWQPHCLLYVKYMWDIPQLEDVTCLSIRSKITSKIEACTQADLSWQMSNFTVLKANTHSASQIEFGKLQIAYLYIGTIVSFFFYEIYNNASLPLLANAVIIKGRS